MTEIGLDLPITLIIVLGSIGLLAVAVWATDKFKFFSAARAMTAPAFALTMIPAFYTVFGTSYQIDNMVWLGVLNQWWLYAVSWYPAYILGILMGGMIRSTGQHLTLPDRFMHYGRLAEFLTSIVSMLYLMPLDVMLMLGILGVMLTNGAIPMEAMIMFLGLVLVAFTAKRGWAGYSIAGVLYFVFMALGIGVASIAFISAAGGWETVLATAGTANLTPWFTDVGGFIKLVTQPANLIWFLMGFAFIVDPMVWQRFSLTENSKAAQKGMLFAFLFWVMFDITTVYTGLAVASLGGDTYLNTAVAYLPAVWVGLILSGNLMVALAGGTAYLHAGGMIFAQNITKSLGILAPNTLSTDAEAKRWYQYGVYFIGAATITLTILLLWILPEAPTTLAWEVVSGLLIGGLAFSAIFGGLLLRDKMPKQSINLSIILGLIVTIGLIVYGLMYKDATSINILGFKLTALGITPDTAYGGSPFVDVSRVYGFIASALGSGIGYVFSLVKRSPKESSV
jgi:Na+/proline symporter